LPKALAGHCTKSPNFSRCTALSSSSEASRRNTSALLCGCAATFAAAQASASAQARQARAALLPLAVRFSGSM